jgi:hypothetical protein
MTISQPKAMTFLFAFLILAVPAGWANQLLNGGFESGTTWVAPPTNWTIAGTLGANPPVVYEDWMPWGTTPHGGTRFAGEAQNWDDKYGGIYQTVNVNPSSTGRAQVYVHILNMGGSGASNEARIGIDPAGGVNPAAGSILWSSTNEAAVEWRLLETPEVSATGGVVTVFLAYSMPTADNGNAVFFDDCSVTGTLADTVIGGTDPPDVTGLALTTSPVVMGDLSFDYVLTDDEDADPDADIDPKFRLGHILDDVGLPGHMYYVVSAQVSTPSATDGNGTGTGAWRIQGVDEGLWRGETDRSGTALVYDDLAPAGYQVTVDIKISDWERTVDEFNPTAVDWEGAGLCLMTRDKQYYYTVGAFDEEGAGNTAIFVEANWHIASGTTGRSFIWQNIQPDLPTDGERPIYFRLVRSATGIAAGWSRTAGALSMFHEIDVSGTALDLSEDLLFGIIVNDQVVVNVEYILTDFISASEGTGGDGRTGLASDSTGASHTDVWDAAGDLSLFGGWVNAQYKLTAEDFHGWGAPDMTDFFLIGVGIATGIPGWEIYR